MSLRFEIIHSRIEGLEPGIHVSPDELASACRRRAREARERSTEICMVTTPDAWTELEGRSSPLGGPEDRAMFLAWRSNSDVVLVGAGTVRAEGYGPPSRQGLRVGVVSGSADLDTTTPLFTSGSGFLITSLDAPERGVETLRIGIGEVDLAGAMAQWSGKVIQVEGGPRLNAALLAADVVDAINLSISPLLTGADGRSFVDGPTPPRDFSLALVARAGDQVMTRYEKIRNA